MLPPYLKIREDVKAGRMDLRELLLVVFQGIAEKGKLNAFSHVFRDSALEHAKDVQQKILAGNAGKLAGAFIAIKDNLCIKGRQTSAASPALKDYKADFNATVVSRLRAEDAIIIGMTNCDEFAMGSSNERSGYGPVLHPMDAGRVPGGSSGGSAVAVAAGFCHAAIGTDTGGSIRQPAAYCGIAALKPSYGSVSRYGCIAYAPTFDQIGPMAADIQTLADVLNVISGSDMNDATSLNNSQPEEPKTKKVLFLNFDEEAEKWDEIKNNISEALSGEIEICEKQVEYEEKLMPVYHVLTMVEASSSMARYQNIFFGQNNDDTFSVINYRSQELGWEVQRKIMAGIMTLHDDTERYENALRWRRIIKAYFDKLAAEYDVLVLPATPTAALRKDQTNDFIDLYRHDKFLLAANLCGLPSLVVPFEQNRDKMPVAVQFMSKKNREYLLIKFAKRLNNIYEISK